MLFSSCVSFFSHCFAQQRSSVGFAQVHTCETWLVHQLYCEEGLDCSCKHHVVHLSVVFSPQACCPLATTSAYEKLLCHLSLFLLITPARRVKTVFSLLFLTICQLQRKISAALAAKSRCRVTCQHLQIPKFGTGLRLFSMSHTLNVLHFDTIRHKTISSLFPPQL